MPGFAFPMANEVAWADYDRDGDLDLLAVSAFGSKLLRNDGPACSRGPRRSPAARSSRWWPTSTSTATAIRTCSSCAACSGCFATTAAVSSLGGDP
jgi:hypothetical protein